MTDIGRYLDYVDETYELIVKHLVEKKLPITDERIRLYFNSIIRPFYFWSQEENQGPDVTGDVNKGSGPRHPEPPRPIGRMVTPSQLLFLKDLRDSLKKDAKDEFLQHLSFQDASKLITEWKAEKKGAKP